MAQPTIYADIDCNGQVEVKVNNDTGFACTIITSAGANDSVSSTGTDVYKYYNLTNSDWVKVVAAQDVTIAANKLTGTIKFGTFTTTSTTTAAPTTTTTAAPTTTTTAAPTTTTTTAAPTTLSCGGSCASPTQFTAIGIANKYQVSLTSSECWYEINLPNATWSTKKIYIDSGTDQISINWWELDNCKYAFHNEAESSWPSGKAISSLVNATAGNTTFRFGLFVTTSNTYDMWIDD